jgi:hypothetical protein
MRHFSTGVLLGFLALGVMQPALAVMPSEFDIYEVPFPSDQFTPQYDMSVQDDLAAAAPGWQAFVADRATDWRAFLWNEANDIPRFAAGEPIPLMASGWDNEEEVAASTQAFLDTIRELIRVDPADLHYASFKPWGERTWVHYTQSYQGLPVFDALLTLHLDHGAVNAISADIYPDIVTNTTPALSAEAAAEFGRADLPWNPETDRLSDATLGVLPVTWGADVGHFLVYELILETAEPEGKWRTFVDANDGEIYWRYNLYPSYTITGNNRGDVQARRADDPYEDLPMRDQRVEADANVVYTDYEGEFEVPVSANQSYTVETAMWGLYLRVMDHYNYTMPEQSAVGSPSNPVEFYWNDANAHVATRDCYYHTNVIHHWLKTVDPDFTGMDWLIFCNVNRTGQVCNANYNGNINFYRQGGGCNNTGQIADIIYHEYGHGITHKTYYPMGPPTPSGMNEGFSDFHAFVLTDDYCLGPSFYISTPENCMRTGLNTRQWPGTECGGQVHCLGEMTMGFLWKARRNLLEKYGPEFAHQVSLYWREAVWGKTSYLPTFVEYFLLANDNNANLADGTPDYWEICDAAVEHGLPIPPVTIYVEFDHLPVADTQNSVDPVLVTTEITTVGAAGSVVPDSTKIHYTYDGITYATAPLTNVGGNTWEGYIPAAEGVLVDYYIRAVTTENVVGTEPARAPYLNTHRFLIGTPVEFFADDLEEDQGWTFGAPDDDATSGLWVRADPELKENGGQIVQPEDDHTPSPGTFCLVTDPQGGFWTFGNVDGGKTSVISPPFDLRGAGAGYVDFYAFLANFGSAADDSLMLYASADGENWTFLWEIHGEGYNDPNYTYQRTYFRGADMGGYSECVQFKFVIEDNENNTVCEGLVDDFIVHVVTDLQDVEDHKGAELTFAAAPAAPSLFATSTAIRFQIPEKQHVELQVFDVGGRVMRTLLNGPLAAGTHVAEWNGRTDAGQEAPSGIYYYRIHAGENSATHKIVLTR